MPMPFSSADQVGDIVARFPQADEVFNRYRIDFCCGGERPLREVIAEKGLDEEEVMRQLHNLYEETQARNDDRTDWRQAPSGEIVDHIINHYHAPLFRELPQLSTYVTKVYRVHGANHPELAEVHKLFHELKLELEQHNIKEEEQIFPLIKAYEKEPDCVSLSRVSDMIEELEQDHDEVGRLLKELRKVTDGYTLPVGACNTYTLVYQKLEGLEKETFRHVHLENHILFPRLTQKNPA